MMLSSVHDHEGVKLLLSDRVRELQGTDVRERRENCTRLLPAGIVGMRLKRGGGEKNDEGL